MRQQYEDAIRAVEIGFCYNDGGREAAGYKGKTGDCVVRSIAIVAGLDYDFVYKWAWDEVRKLKKSKSPRLGVPIGVMHKMLKELGWKWFAQCGIGTGCKVHLRKADLPSGRIVARVSKHVCAVIDGVIHDTYDPSRDGTRCVYGYWKEV